MRRTFCLLLFMMCSAGALSETVPGKLTWTSNSFLQPKEAIEGVGTCSSTAYDVTDLDGMRYVWLPDGTGLAYEAPSPTVVCFGVSRLYSPNGWVSASERSTLSGAWSCPSGQVAGGRPLPPRYEGYPPTVVSEGDLVSFGGYVGRPSLTCQCLWGMRWDNEYKYCTNTPPPRGLVVLDPGHGLSCGELGMLVGAQGVTNFPASDPPPGLLREDDLTVAIALETERQLRAANYKVTLTKRDVSSCPTYAERSRIASNARAKAFVSIHVDRPNRLGSAFPLDNGTVVFYHSSKPERQPMAEYMASTVSTMLGVNNRGTKTRDDLAVLSPRAISVPAVLLEVARLSGKDEMILHWPTTPERVAAGIKLTLDNFLPH